MIVESVVNFLLWEYLLFLWECKLVSWICRSLLWILCFFVLHFPNEGNEGIHYPVVVGPEQLVSELEVSCDNFAVWDFPLKISYVEAVDICD